MAFFYPRTIYNTDASIAPIIRLLDEFDNQSRRSRCSVRRAHAPVARWQPRFDVRETEGAYHLHGELPGLSKEDISIDFPDHQQIIIRGKTESDYASTPAATIDAAPAEHAETETATGDDDTSSRHSYRATVEDGDDSDDESSAFEEIANTNEKPEAKQSEDETMPDAEFEKTKQPKAAPNDTSKYWFKERSIGQFVRGFSFAERVEQDGATASLENGILTVTVPKARKHEPRHIPVF